MLKTIGKMFAGMTVPPEDQKKTPKEKDISMEFFMNTEVLRRLLLY